ncbi:unnamed protein product [Amaranthus hypochondriacus]
MSNGGLWSLINKKTYTLNFDGSHINQKEKARAGAGCIIRDSQGEFVIAAAYNLADCNVAIAEATALRNGLDLARQYNLSISLIKGDNTQVIDHVLGKSRNEAKSPLKEIIQKIKGHIHLKKIEIKIVGREANKVADKLAKWGRNMPDSEGHLIYTSYVDLPSEVADLIRQDKALNYGEGSSNSMAWIGGALLTAGALAYGVSKLLKHDDDDYRGNAIQNYASQRTKDYYTLNFDGSDNNQLQKGGAGCIIRNKQGNLIIAASYNLDNYYPNQCNVAIAEAIAFRNGLMLAKMKRIKLDLIKGDNKEVMDRVLGNERKAARVSFLNDIICEIKEALDEQFIDPQTQMMLIGREANEVANELATLGSSELEFGMDKIYTTDEDLTPRLNQLIQKDKILNL